MVEIGIKGRQETVVTMANVATNVGSGKVKVFATPMMIALMEKTAVLSIEPFLEEGQSSVGTHIDVSHCAATPLGMSVWAESEVIEVDRRRVTFAVRAYDERGLIGEGTHDRFIIDVEKFQSKAASGLYEILEEGMLFRFLQRGDGTVCPRPSDIVFCKYKGLLMDGSVFDSTEGEPYPAYFRVRELIEGWQIALQRMHAGDRCEIILPARMGYGSQRVDGIPAYSTLIFELELVKIA